MSEAVVIPVEVAPDMAPSAPAAHSTCESPPPAPQPAREAPLDPRVRLHQLAAELVRSHNRRLVIEYLRLRRAVS